MSCGAMDCGDEVVGMISVVVDKLCGELWVETWE
jgi:hypothetical protein